MTGAGRRFWPAAVRGAPAAAAGGGLPDARLAQPRPTTRCRRPGCGSAAPTRRRHREPRRLADDGRRAAVPRHAALAQVAARGAAATCGARPGRRVRRRRRPRASRRCWPTRSGSRCWSCSRRSTPAERLAFVLHDLFAVPFDDIAPIVGRSPPRPGSWPAGPAAGSQGATPAGSPTAAASARSSTRSSPPPAVATSRLVAAAPSGRRAARRPGGPGSASCGVRRRSPVRRGAPCAAGSGSRFAVVNGGPGILASIDGRGIARAGVHGGRRTDRGGRHPRRPRPPGGTRHGAVTRTTTRCRRPSPASR